MTSKSSIVEVSKSHQAGKTSGAVATAEPEDAPVLPPEIVLEIMKILKAQRYGRNKRLHLLRVMMACRQYYEIGLPLLLEDCRFIWLWKAAQISNFLQDGLCVGKFRHIKRLGLRFANVQDGNESFKLLELAAPSIVELSITISCLDK